MSDYHYGYTIEEFRKKRKVTQAALAQDWPKADGTKGVDVRYVQAIEAGTEKIVSRVTLYGLVDLLGIPPWRFGLSEFDPFHPEVIHARGRSLVDESLDDAECLLRNAWYLRRRSPLALTERTVRRLNHLFAYYQSELPPPANLEPRFLQLYAQVQRLNAVMAVEHKDYKGALNFFELMLKTARQLKQEDYSIIALALMGMGTELERQERQQEAVGRLEEARDASFRASKNVQTVVHAYLARAYASVGDAIRFRRAIDMALSLALDLGKSYGDGTDFVYHSLSGVLAEKSYGLLDIKEPEKTLHMKNEINQQIEVEGNVWLEAWIPLDWARAYFMQNEIEESVKQGKEFLKRASRLGSPHTIRRAFQHLERLEKQYSDVQAVREFREELEERQREQQQAEEKSRKQP